MTAITVDQAYDMWYKHKNPVYRDSIGLVGIGDFLLRGGFRGSQALCLYDKHNQLKTFGDFCDMVKSAGWGLI